MDRKVTRVQPCLEETFLEEKVRLREMSLLRFPTGDLAPQEPSAIR